jgi:hypothetical protein
MRPSLLTLYLLAAMLALGCSEQGPPPKETSVPIEIVGTSPIIEIKVNGRPVPVHFDLGNSDSVSLFPTFLDEVEKERVGDTGGRKSLYGSEEGKPIYRVETVQVGDFGFANFDVVEDFHDAEFQEDFIETRGAYGFVGPGLFKDYGLVIDYGQKRLTIIAQDALGSPQSSCRGREISLMPQSNSDIGALVLAKTEIGDVRLVWDTGAPANIILKDRTDAADLELPEYEELTLTELSLGGHDFGPARFFVRDFKIPPFDGLIGFPFFEKHVVCFDLPGNRLFIQGQ